MKKLCSLLTAAVLSPLFLISCSSERANDLPAAADKPQAAASGPTGRIRGVVKFQGTAPAPAFEPTSQDQSTCGDRVPVTRLALGKDSGVQNAFVYLDGVTVPSNLPPKSVLIDQKKCEYAPHTVIVPVGSKLDITNSDAILHNVHGHQVTNQESHTLFNVAQPVQGQRTTVESPLTTPGIVHLTCEAGHPWMSAYIYVADHPYVASTNDNGEFVIDNVPVGTYRIKMWHEGVTLKQNIKSLQRYEYEEPYEITQDVTVQAGGEAVINFNLVLRPRAN
jgi:plastocyanin